MWVYNYINVLYHTKNTCDKIYLRMHMQLQKHLFVEFRKNNPVFWKYPQNKANIGQDTSLDFADISD